MNFAGNVADIEKRRAIFRGLTSYFGKVLPAKFYQKTSQFLPEVERVHPLIEGIFKPAWSSYALTVASMLKSPYRDKVEFNAGRSWLIYYSPKAGGPGRAQNAALAQCMTDRQPVLVIRQEHDKRHSAGTQYQLLGLGLVVNFDAASDLFQIRGLTWDEISQFTGEILTDDLLPTALRLEALEQWTPFLKEDRAVYRVSRTKRDSAFRDVVLENYENACAITGQKFKYEQVIEADAAHIIGKNVNGTDDPRNGVALSKTAHWAFDVGIFRISNEYEIIIHPNASQAMASNFPLLEMNRKRIRL